MSSPSFYYPRDFRKHVDNGIQVTTENQRLLLHNYSNTSFNKFLKDYGKNFTYKVKGQGLLYVIIGDGSYLSIPCWYKPSITVTIISPGEAVSSNKDIWSAHTILYHHFCGIGEV